RQVVRKVYSLPTVPHTPVVSSTPQPVGTTILPSTGQIMIGISAIDDSDSVNAFENRVGKKMSVILLYQSWGDADANFPVDWVNAVRAHGSLPMITWEPWVTAAYPAGNDEPAYALSNLIAGKFDTYITQWADAAKAWKSPFFLRFAPEMNGNWNPWSEGLN